VSTPSPSEAPGAASGRPQAPPARSFSVVIPSYNEEATLDELIDRCVAACDSVGRRYEIVIVDDGSTDASREHITAKAEQYGGRVLGIFLNRNYGQHTAVFCGFANVTGDLIITLDADLQNPPEEIPRLVATADEGFDVVGTVRTNRQDSLFRRIASHLVNRMVLKSTGVSMHDYGCMLRAYSKPVVGAMLECEERSTFIPVLANLFARRTTEIDVAHHERVAGESKYGLMKLVNLMFDLLTAMTTTPLRLMSIAGVALFLAGGSLGVLLLGLRLYYGAEWAGGGAFTLFALMFVFIGLQFAAIGLLGEYVGRIQQDVRARPRYLIDSRVGGSGGGLQWEPEQPRAAGTGIRS
jgi:undecaprenyl-phosphate 4-deoxy-4-formamido-L-arabinose transferase